MSETVRAYVQNLRRILISEQKTSLQRSVRYFITSLEISIFSLWLFRQKKLKDFAEAIFSIKRNHKKWWQKITLTSLNLSLSLAQSFSLSHSLTHTHNIYLSLTLFLSHSLLLSYAANLALSIYLTLIQSLPFPLFISKYHPFILTNHC